MNGAPSTPSAKGLEASIAHRTGLSFSGSRGRWLRSVLESAAAAEPQAPGRWHALLGEDQVAADPLCDALTVQESFFFREPSRLAVLRDHVFPQLRERGGPVRVWSAGCATGEEVYTLAMLLTDAGFAQRYRVLGTDLSPKAVAVAREAQYGRWSMRGVSARALDRYFSLDSQGYRVGEEYRTNVRIEQHNLLDPLPVGSGSFDLILCRNVLIYFTPEATRRAARSLLDALAPGGWLLLGVSDPLLDGIAELEPVRTDHGLVYRRRSQVDEAVSVGRPAGPPRRPRPTVRAPRPTPDRPTPTLQPSAVAGPEQDVDVSVLLTASEQALEQGRPRVAQEHARRALGLAPGDRAAHGLLTQALAGDGRLQEAAGAAAVAVSRFPEDAELRSLQAIIMLERGELSDAGVTARRAVYLDPRYALAHLVLARAHEGLGDPVAAKRSRRNAHRLMTSTEGP